jgi:hypothetical protein
MATEEIRSTASMEVPKYDTPSGELEKGYYWINTIPGFDEDLQISTTIQKLWINESGIERVELDYDVSKLTQAIEIGKRYISLFIDVDTGEKLIDEITKEEYDSFKLKDSPPPIKK